MLMEDKATKRTIMIIFLLYICRHGPVSGEASKKGSRLTGTTAQSLLVLELLDFVSLDTSIVIDMSWERLTMTLQSNLIFLCLTGIPTSLWVPSGQLSWPRAANKHRR